jgi:tyrosyl-tRNA synthetase
MPDSPFLQEAMARGFFAQCTDLEALDAALLAGPVGGYIGFDATADSLHVGSMVQIMLLRLLGRHGHAPVVVLGGGTTRIGDPSGKDESRQMMTDERIAANCAGITAVLTPFLGEVRFVNNADWLDRLGYIEMLREVGPHFTINRMLTFESVRLRLEREQPLTFREFNYLILPSYDFRELSRRHGVRLQMGGSDQWGNIVSGIELTRRTDGVQVFGLTTPLITTASGAKMGKTAKGAVWLTADRVSPYDYWQFWRNVEDADTGRFLRLFTEIPLDEIEVLERLEGAGINEAKKRLATAATALAHGQDAAEAAAETARRTFEQGDAAESLPTLVVEAGALAAGLPLVRLLVESGLAASNGEARRLIRGGGARINDVAVTDEARMVEAEALRDGAIKLSVGKKQHRLVKVG